MTKAAFVEPMLSLAVAKLPEGTTTAEGFLDSDGIEVDKPIRIAVTITIKEQSSSKYRVQFIGKNGRVLNESTSNPATYTFTGDEGYVRAKIFESNGRVAWTQPVIR